MHLVITDQPPATADGSDLWTEALAILSGSNEGLDHFGADEVAVELIQLRQPELVAGVVSVRAAVWIPPQVTEELHEHERAVEFIRHQGSVLSDFSQSSRSGGRIARGRGCSKLSDGGVAIRSRWRTPAFKKSLSTNCAGVIEVKRAEVKRERCTNSFAKDCLLFSSTVSQPGWPTTSP